MRGTRVRRLDAGITGHDWVVETRRESRRGVGVGLRQAAARACALVLALPETRRSGKRATWRKVVATEVVHITESYLARHGVKAPRGVFPGAQQKVKVPQLAEAIVTVTETGSSLRANPIAHSSDYRAGVRDRCSS